MCIFKLTVQASLQAKQAKRIKAVTVKLSLSLLTNDSFVNASDNFVQKSGKK